MIQRLADWGNINPNHALPSSVSLSLSHLVMVAGPGHHQWQDWRLTPSEGQRRVAVPLSSHFGWASYVDRYHLQLSAQAIIDGSTGGFQRWTGYHAVTGPQKAREGASWKL